ncbi:MAG: relaxase domain-containing protein [Acidimicrobiales bacterium]
MRGHDVTCSAPKSVSLLAALGDSAVQAEVRSAHEAAVDAVLGYVKRHALTRFRVDGEVVSVDAEGIVAGCFVRCVAGVGPEAAHACGDRQPGAVAGWEVGSGDRRNAP